MTKKLFAQAMTIFFLGVLGVGSLIFLPAGTLIYAPEWLLMGILFVPMFLAGPFLMVIDPDRLKRRLDAWEKEMPQKQVLLRELPGYKEYRQKVRWRMIPGLW